MSAVCWKGLAQIVTPLRYGNVHYGMLYAGLWRNGETASGLPGDFYRSREQLPELPESMAALFALCRLAADQSTAGLLTAFGYTADDGCDLLRIIFAAGNIVQEE